MFNLADGMELKNIPIPLGSVVLTPDEETVAAATIIQEIKNVKGLFATEEIQARVQNNYLPWLAGKENREHLDISKFMLWDWKQGRQITSINKNEFARMINSDQTVPSAPCPTLSRKITVSRALNPIRTLFRVLSMKYNAFRHKNDNCNRDEGFDDGTFDTMPDLELYHTDPDEGHETCDSQPSEDSENNQNYSGTEDDEELLNRIETVIWK